jgi:hypothetical protein
MKPNHRNILLAIFGLFLFALTSCQRDTVTLTCKISRFGNSKTCVEDGGKVYIDGLTPKWNDGDTIRINENSIIISSSDGTTATMQVPATNVYKAVYPCSIAQPLVNGNTAQLFLPRLQIYREGDNHHQIVAIPMCAMSSSSTLRFKNMGALLAINLINGTNHQTITVDSISVKSVAYGSTTDSPAAATALWGEATADISSSEPTYTFTDMPTAGVNDSVTLALQGNRSLNITLSNNTTEAQHKEVYINVPAISSTANNLFSIRVFANDGNGKRYTYLLSQSTAYSGNIGRNQKADVPFSMTNGIEHEHIINTVPEGALTGIFTVDGNRTKVYFSKGNLQYREIGTHLVAGGGTPIGTWRFAENQWDYLADTELPANSNDWNDLFGWGTSGNNVLPTNHSTLNSTFAPYMVGTNFDWGQYNAISNGNSEQAGLWRTLTSAEWSYLLGYPSDGRIVNGHSGAGYCYNILKVNSTWGLLIYPDGFTGQSNHNINSILTEIPEGCVFLPMAGRRDGTTISGVNVWGYYWTSTTSGTLTNPTPDAFAMRFNKNGNNINDIGERDKYNGYSVRLVQNVTSTQK